MRLQGKTAFITGGGTGIGLACSRLFCREGAEAAIFGRRPDRRESAAKEIGPSILPVAGDIAKT